MLESRGLVELRLGDNDKAIADYTQVIRLDPTDIGDAWINRGRAYALKGETDKAIADLSSAIELYPNDAEPYNERASLYRLKGDIAKADADYNLALPLNRRDAQKRLALYQAHQPYHTDKEL